LQPLRWCCVDCVIHHERDVREEQHHTYMWREQPIIEWSWHVNSIVACYHSAKLCAYATRGFRSQHYKNFETNSFCDVPVVSRLSSYVHFIPCTCWRTFTASWCEMVGTKAWSLITKIWSLSFKRPSLSATPPGLMSCSKKQFYHPVLDH